MSCSPKPWRNLEDLYHAVLERLLGSRPRAVQPAGQTEVKGLGLWTIIAFTIVLLAGFVVLDQIAPTGKRFIKIRGIDTVSYFATAHSVLFDHDFNLNNEYQRMPPDNRFWTHNQPATGLPGNVWGLGYSLLMMPLLMLGTGVDALAGNPADGYSRWAVFFYCIGNPLITGSGMVTLFILMRGVARFWKIMPEDHQSAIALFVVFVIFFGTNVGFYSIAMMSHASTFLFASLFLVVWWRYRESEDGWGWLLMGLIGGFLSICRWQDVLYLAGPLLYGLFGGFGGDVLKRGLAWWRMRLLYAAGAGVCWIPQVMEWRAIYGKLLTIPQGGGFMSLPPLHVLQVLLSTRTGWFIWTPITMLGLAGLFLGTFRATRIYLPWIIVLALEIVVVGSVSTWHGDDSFGSRYLLSSTPLIGFGIITLYSVSGVWLRRGLTATCLACCCFTILFAIQWGLDLVPKYTRLTFSELVSDKLRLAQVRQRKAATRQAQELLAKADADSAIRVLEGTLSLGEDRDVDVLLEKAYRSAGNQKQADAMGLRYRAFMGSRLY